MKLFRVYFRFNHYDDWEDYFTFDFVNRVDRLDIGFILAPIREAGPAPWGRYNGGVDDDPNDLLAEAILVCPDNITAERIYNMFINPYSFLRRSRVAGTPPSLENIVILLRDPNTVYEGNIPIDVLVNILVMAGMAHDNYPTHAGAA